MNKSNFPKRRLFSELGGTSEAGDMKVRKNIKKISYEILAHYCTNMNKFRSISNGSSYNVSLFYAHARINL